MTFDPRAEVIGVLDLVSIDTVDGVFRFLVGVDGRFTDIDGHEWIGCQMIGASDLRASIQGEAAGGTLSLTFIQDPEDGDLIGEILSLGTDYIRDREIIFWDQPLLSVEEFHAPSLPPERLMTRRGSYITYDLDGALDRRITLAFEGPFTGRNTARGLQYTVADHARLIGEANSSLRFMPTDHYQEQKLFG